MIVGCGQRIGASAATARRSISTLPRSLRRLSQRQAVAGIPLQRDFFAAQAPGVLVRAGPLQLRQQRFVEQRAQCGPVGVDAQRAQLAGAVVDQLMVDVVEPLQPDGRGSRNQTSSSSPLISATRQALRWSVQVSVCAGPRPVRSVTRYCAASGCQSGAADCTAGGRSGGGQEVQRGGVDAGQVGARHRTAVARAVVGAQRGCTASRWHPSTGRWGCHRRPARSASYRMCDGSNRPSRYCVFDAAAWRANSRYGVSASLGLGPSTAHASAAEVLRAADAALPCSQARGSTGAEHSGAAPE